LEKLGSISFPLQEKFLSFYVSHDFYFYVTDLGIHRFDRKTNTINSIPISETPVGKITLLADGVTAFLVLRSQGKQKKNI